MNVRPARCAARLLFVEHVVRVVPGDAATRLREGRGAGVEYPPPFIFAVFPVMLPEVMVSVPPLLMPPLLYSVARLPLMVAPASMNCAAGLSP